MIIKLKLLEFWIKWFGVGDSYQKEVAASTVSCKCIKCNSEKNEPPTILSMIRNLKLLEFWIKWFGVGDSYQKEVAASTVSCKCIKYNSELLLDICCK